MSPRRTLHARDLGFLAKVRVRFAFRPEFDGRPLKPEFAALNGRECVMEVGWCMGRDERYPGEYAILPCGRERSGLPVYLSWIASGDVEILSVVSPGIPNADVSGPASSADDNQLYRAGAAVADSRVAPSGGTSTSSTK